MIRTSVLRSVCALIIFFLSVPQHLDAQNMYKPSAYEISTLAEWAQKMYSEHPNLYEVDSLYDSYYATHSFEKSYHTQYYKRWRREVLEFANENGELVFPDPAKAKQIQNEFLQKQSTASTTQWSVAGPIQVLNNSGVPGKRQSNIYSIDQCLANPNVLYCGSEPGEVYKSADGGDTWSNVSIGQVFGGGVTSVECDPTNADIVFAGSNNGLFRSTDGGVSWTQVLIQTGFGANEILVNPANHLLVLAGSNKGLWRSADGGDTWSQLYIQKSFDVKFKPSDPSVVYLVKDNPTLGICEFYLSTDSGATWTIQTNGWYNSNDPARNNGGARLAVTPADPNRVYAYLIGEAKANDYGFIGVYRSDDGGLSWTLPNGPAGGPYTASHPNLAYGYPAWTYHQGFYNCAITASESDADKILIGGLNLWRSNDGGLTFSSVAGYVGGPLNMHVDMQDFRTIGTTTWITTDGGIYRSTDFYTSQPEFKMYGVHASDYWGFGSGWNEDVLVGGLYHNGNLAYHENYGNGNFLELGGGEAPTGYVNPGENRKAYFSDIGGKYLPLSITGTISNFSIGKNPTESYYAAESSEMEFHPNCYNIAYIGNENKLWKTTDGGASYNLVYAFDTIIGNKVKYIEVSSSNPDVIYLTQQPASGNTGKIWKTTDGGITWTNLVIPSGNSRRMLIAADALDSDIIWAAYTGGSNGNKIYRSTDGGISWTNLTTAMLNNEQAQSIINIASTDGGIYYCTNKSVYYRNNQMSDWQIDNNGLPLNISTNIARPFYRDSKIRIASYGKGIWENSLFENPSFPIARINVDKLSQVVICNTDSFYFEDHSFLNHANASWSWTFQNGTPATSTQRNPVVYFNGTGSFMATLTITDANGLQDSDTLFVDISSYNIPGIIAEDFENGFLPGGWDLYNEDNGGQWSVSTSAGGYGLSSRSAIFDNYNINSLATYDDLITYVNTTNTFNPVLSFDVAYAPYGGIYSDTLEVLVSVDCGVTFTSLYKKGGVALSTASPNQNFFTPAANEWRTDSISLLSYIGQNNLLVAFRNIGHWGNSIYIDNVNINNNFTSIPEHIATTGVFIYPNPVGAGGCVQFEMNKPATEVSLYNPQGKLILNKKLSGMAGLDIPAGLSPGNYIISIKNPAQIFNKLLIIR